MDCCTVNDLDKVFGKRFAEADLQHYLKKGLDRRASALVRLISQRGVEGAAILEVGPGVGALHMELLKAGATSAAGYDASPAYVAAATDLAQRLGFQDRVQYHVGDFVDPAFAPAEADIVVLDRVVCCYPDMTALLSKSGRLAKGLYAVSFPRPTWYMRTGRLFLNLGFILIRRRYRFYLHPHRAIVQAIQAQGLRLVEQARSGLWQIQVYERGVQSEVEAELPSKTSQGKAGAHVRPPLERRNTP
ncbi:MAG: methyltransferase domain-containing protein [Chloroflexi bacterium]|nr:methyltransferase domain-containing protein [Chloroflexota bacterium]